MLCVCFSEHVMHVPNEALIYRACHLCFVQQIYSKDDPYTAGALVPIAFLFCNDLLLFVCFFDGLHCAGDVRSNYFFGCDTHFASILGLEICTFLFYVLDFPLYIDIRICDAFLSNEWCFNVQIPLQCQVFIMTKIFTQMIFVIF